MPDKDKKDTPAAGAGPSKVEGTGDAAKNQAKTATTEALNDDATGGVVIIKQGGGK